MDYREQLLFLKKQIERDKSITLELPDKFTFKDLNVYDFNTLLSFFDWSIKDCPVKIDLRRCKTANYQAISLLVLYSWHLKSQGCTVSMIESEDDTGASAMWRRIGARGTFQVLFHNSWRFKGDKFKPLIAVRNTDDFKFVIESAEDYTKEFNVEYGSTLRYVLSELLYNTLEHGNVIGSESIRNIRIPSIVQFTWYQKHNEIHFIIADIGMGIKNHLEQTYPGIESHESAIRHAIKPKISGTFGQNNPYKNKNNAGMGLYISTNIIRRLNADMHVVSGDGLLHISPRDITGKTLNNSWPGTLVLVTIKIDNNPSFLLHKIMQEFREAADKEQILADSMEMSARHYLNVENYFGKYAEDKEAAVKYRDRYLFKSIDEGKNILIDFNYVVSAPHSFLSALLASPIKVLGMNSYKRIKIINAAPEIRETIDFIFEDNT